MNESREVYRTNSGPQALVPLKPLDPRLRLIIQALQRCLGILCDTLKKIEEMR
jgi:hypothetical protein